MSRSFTLHRGGKASPHDLSMERAVLGAVMLDSRRLHEMVQEARLLASDFHSPPHGNLWALYGEMAAAGIAPDVVTVASRVAATPDRFGGMAYVMTLPGQCMAIEGAVQWAIGLKGLSARRRLQSLTGEAQEWVADPTLDVPELAERIRRGVEEVVTDSDVVTSWKGMKETLQTAFNTIQARADGRETGVASWPWASVERMAGRLVPGKLTIVAARPGIGKSAFMQQLLLRAAMENVACGFITLEMDEAEVTERALSMVGRVDSIGIRDGRLSGDEWGRIQDAADALEALPMWTEYAPGLTMGALRGLVYRLQRKAEQAGTPLRLVAVDYLGLISGGNPRQPLYQFLGELTRGLKRLAGETGIHFVVACQLNRNIEARTDKRPLMSDIRDSGSIEQDADIIIGLSRDDEGSPDKATISVLKSRRGTTGHVNCQWIGKHYTFGEECS